MLMNCKKVIAYTSSCFPIENPLLVIFNVVEF